MSEATEHVDVKKPAWLSKTNWGVVVSVVALVLGYFGVDSTWLTNLAIYMGVEPVALGAAMVAAINVVLKVATWAWFKWVAKKAG
jgi:hypothetical protein